jgi:hypothetical protein
MKPLDSTHKAEIPVSSEERQLPAETVRTAMERVLASRSFLAAETLSRFLRHTVEQALEGRGDRLKEYSLGIDVLGRSAEFDPRIDSIVRMEASRLRSRLAEYYRSEGRDDPSASRFPGEATFPASGR